MQWHEKVIAMHTAVTDAVSHNARMKSDRYFVWQEEGRNDFEADGKHGEKAVAGSTDLFTKTEFDPWAQEFENSMNGTSGVAWSLNNVDYEEETGFYHYEWVWQVI